MRARATYLTQSGIRLLHDWGAALQRAFPGHTAYLVGSALIRADYRDVDVRVIFEDEAYTDLSMMVNPADLNLAVSLWGQQVTGLPVDFQVQSDTDADQYNGRRHPLGLVTTARQDVQ